MNADVASLEINEETKAMVWATLIALFLLEEVFGDEETKWELIAQKAKDYLKV